MFTVFIDSAIDRRSNRYLYFDAGLVPRALGVQLSEFYVLVYLLIVFHLIRYRLFIVLFLLLIDYCVDTIYIRCY